MKQNSIGAKYYWGLYINIGVSLICIVMIIGLAYQKNKYSYPVKVQETLSVVKPSITTSEYENISKDLPNQIDNIHAFVNVIRQQSKEQLRERQKKNSESNFHPESIIPKFFKDFYGDASSMTR